MKTKTLLSGIQPTGSLHLGNHLGVIKQWKDLQENPEYECKFMIADLHAFTTTPFTKDSNSEITRKVSQTYATLLSMGIRAHVIFLQSDYRAQILDTFWSLACNTSIGQLNRMTQFKDKSDKGNENLGLYCYPVLMAADIIAFDADVVLVGEDQKQHLELTRDLTKKIGLKIPEPLISKTCGRIMSLTDPNKKMSKSDPNDNSRINLSDNAETIQKKIGKAVTTEEGRLNLEKIFVGCGGAEDGILNWSEARRMKEIVAEQVIKELGKCA